MTRNESQLVVRQSTAVNPHVIPLVAAKLHIQPQQQRRQRDWALTEDDLPRSRRRHTTWYASNTPHTTSSCFHLMCLTPAAGPGISGSGSGSVLQFRSHYLSARAVAQEGRG